MPIPMYDLCKLDGFYLVQAIRDRAQKKPTITFQDIVDYICDVLGFTNGQAKNLIPAATAVSTGKKNLR